MQCKVGYWLGLCDEDVSVANILLDNKKYLQAGFFCHMIVEKALKAVVASVTNEIPPKIHKLRKLADMGQLTCELSQSQIDFFIELDPLNIEARYPEYKANISEYLNYDYTKNLLKEAEEFLCWIKQRLKK